MQAAERKAITMNVTLNEELESATAEHRPVSCNFVVDEVSRQGPCLHTFGIAGNPIVMQACHGCALSVHHPKARGEPTGSSRTRLAAWMLSHILPGYAISGRQ